jgi:DedD protein
MRFLPFLKRSDEPRRSRGRVLPPPDLASVEQLRTRTRRRLIGAAVLVTAAVVLLPMALEGTPRPPGSPVAIDMPARPAAPGPAAEGLAARAAPLRGGEVSASAASSAATPGAGVTPAVAAASTPAAARRSESTAAIKAATPAAAVALAAAQRPAPQGEAAAPRKPAPAVPASHAVTRPATERKAVEADKAKAAAARGDKPVAAKPAADKTIHADAKARAERKEPRAEAKPAAAKKPAEPRVFVQVGAYAEANTVKSVRQRVDKLGMKSHEQTVETASGQRTRVRLGPFSSREEADRAAAKLRAGGLGATVVTP